MDILENGGMIGFDGLYKFRFIYLFYKRNEGLLKIHGGYWNYNIS